MATRRRRKTTTTKRRRGRSPAKTLIITRQRVGMIMLGVAFLYFFAYFFAPGAPVIVFFNSNVALAFGELGVFPFFLVTGVSGGLILRRGQMIGTWLKMYGAVVMLLSALLNFAVLSSGIDASTPVAVARYKANGGFVSWPLLWGIAKLFGESILATQLLIILLCILVLWWISHVFELSINLPRFEFQMPDRSTTHKTVRSSPKKNKKTSLTPSIKRFGDTLTDVDSSKTKKTVDKDSVKKMLMDRVRGSSETKKEEKKHTMARYEFPSDKPTFTPGQVLDVDKGPLKTVDEKFLIQQVNDLQAKLAEFNVPVEIDGFDIGPSVIQVRVKPDPGIKVSAIVNLQSDIALSLKAKGLRIIAPIPGTSCVGIQIPNPKPQMVRLSSILESEVFLESMQKNYTNLALGKNVAGEVVVKSLEKMPHLLVAGATGAGKSVGVNDMILSLMYQNTPSEMKFLMVDPKQVEMELYSGLPYLMAPIITDPDKALRMLKWTVDEMENRYTLLKKNRLKHIDEFNKQFPENSIYRIVVIIDELADLMMSGNKKEVEICITRIAQKARAVGIHLIVATQRPSVNVITGLIKANMPTRISFATVSQIDSRTILGVKGAEELVGRGDMLYMDPATKYPERLQAPFVDTHEINHVVKYLQMKYMKGISEDDMYHPDLMEVINGSKTVHADFGGSGNGGADDQLVEDAIRIIASTGKASATMLQRKLNVGFARAARIMDMLEERGVVGPQEGSKAREVLI